MTAREDIEFKTTDGVTLRGWFFKSTKSGGKAPTIVMAHGFSATKEFDLEDFAKVFQAEFSVLVYDHRGFGDSDTGPNRPRQELIPHEQISDWMDAITYAQSRSDVDPDRIGIWGSSYAGAHVLQIGATDKRVKAVCSQVPLVSGSGNFKCLVRSDIVPVMLKAISDDCLARARGEQGASLPVVDPDPMAPSALPTADSWEFFNRVGLQGKGKGKWVNSVTMRSMQFFVGYEPGRFIDLISPTPLLMVVAEKDVLTPAYLALEAYSRAHEPKQLKILKGAGHFDGYTGKYFAENSSTQFEFFKRALLE